MRQLIRSGLVRILLSGVFLAQVFSPAFPANAQERKSIDAEELWLEGVANMFRLSENTDASVCDPLLQSINYHIENPSLPVFSVSEPKWKISKSQPFLLLRNKFLVDPWRRNEYRYRNRNTSEINSSSFEATVLDFDGDGSLDGLFRQWGMIRGKVLYGVWSVRSAPDQVVNNHVLEEQTARDLWKKENGFPEMGHWGHFIEVVRIAEKPYAIVANAAYWTLKDKARLPSVKLMELGTHGWRSVCSFEGVLEITRKY